MKKSIFLLAIVLVAGCKTPQRTAFNTIGALEQTANAAVDGYDTAVIKGLVSTNELPRISALFNQFQADAALAATVSQAGTNALAPASLAAELGNLTSVISTIKPFAK